MTVQICQKMRGMGGMASKKKRIRPFRVLAMLMGAGTLAMLSAIEENWYNPSSLYTPGQQASGVLMDARVRISRCLGCLPKEIYFTSGGSEADNQAILSAAAIGKRQGKMHII